jgi:hypothetical protein
MSEASRAIALQHAASVHHGSGDPEAALATAEAFHSFIVGTAEAPAAAAAKPAKPAAKKAAAKTPPPVDEDAEPAADEVSKEQVGEAIEKMLNANLRPAAIKLFAKYGAKSLSGVKPEDYAAVKQDADDALLNA